MTVQGHAMASTALESDTGPPSDPGGLGPAGPLHPTWTDMGKRKGKENTREVEKDRKTKKKLNARSCPKNHVLTSYLPVIQYFDC